MADLEFERLLRAKFLEDTQKLLGNAAPALRALALDSEAAVPLDQLYRVAHNFKSGALTVGLEELGLFSKALEALVSAIQRGEIEFTGERKALLARSFQELDRVSALLGKSPDREYKIAVSIEEIKSAQQI